MILYHLLHGCNTILTLLNLHTGCTCMSIHARANTQEYENKSVHNTSCEIHGAWKSNMRKISIT